MATVAIRLRMTDCVCMTNTRMWHYICIVGGNTELTSVKFWRHLDPPHPTFVELPSKSVFEGVTLILIADASYAEFDAVVPAPYSFCQTDETVLHLGVSLSLASSVL